MDILMKILSLLPWVVAINVGLSGISKALIMLKDKLPALGKIGDALAAVCSILQKIADLASANLPH